MSGNARVVCLDNLGALVVGDLSFSREVENHGMLEINPASARSLTATDFGNELDDHVQRAEDLDAFGAAILRYGFMGDVNPAGELVNCYALVENFDEEQELIQLLPAIARILSRDPAFLRLSQRILFTAPDRSWQVALSHLLEAIEAIRKLHTCMFLDKNSIPSMDTLGAIEYVEQNIFPAWKERYLQKSQGKYHRYLRTEHWRRTRTATLTRDNYRCRLCDSDRRLEVHHKTYKNLWNESPDDLITLCHKCHSKFHDQLP